MLLFAAATSFGWPPVTTGAFWLLASVYGLVSVFFDDEAVRGTPGIDVIYAIREQRKNLV
jgi:predicted anti-sigma-YlaC factor YlaD